MSYATTQMREELKDHVLAQVLDTPDFRAFYLRSKHKLEYGRVMSTLFIFSPEGITICGDLRPDGPSGSASHSDYGYGLTWFSGNLSERYLCEKFMHEVWQRDVAAEECSEHADEIERGEHDDHFAHNDELYREVVDAFEAADLLSEIDPQRAEKIRTVSNELAAMRHEKAEKYRELAATVAGWEFDDTGRFYDLWSDLGGDFEDLPGMDYKRKTAGWLCALQQKFAEEYAKIRPVLPTVTEKLEKSNG